MEVPKLFFQRKYLFESVAFISLFSVLFMAIYQPYSATTWFGFSTWRTFAITFLFYLLGISTLVVSKFLLIRFQKRHNCSGKTYLLWILAEFFSIAVEYWALTQLFGMSSTHTTFVLIVKIMFCVAFILAIPYTIITFYAAYRSKKEELELFKLNHKKENLSPEGRLVKLSDSSGKTKMSVDQSSIFYIESQDNYVQVYYELDGKLTSYLLRISTQKMEEYLTDTSIVRCHRSYLVNTTKIVKFKKERGRARITLTAPSNKELVVTPSHYRNILSHLDSRSL